MVRRLGRSEDHRPQREEKSQLPSAALHGKLYGEITLEQILWQNHEIPNFPQHSKVMNHYKPILVGGLEHEFYDFPFIGNIIIPTDELIFFRGVGTPTGIKELLVGPSLQVFVTFLSLDRLHGLRLRPQRCQRLGLGPRPRGALA